jgi:hypothetical protein
MDATVKRSRGVRWTTGVYGGLGAGVFFRLYIVFVRGAIFHDTTLSAWFAFLASAFLGDRANSPAVYVTAFGAGLHFLGSAIAGIIYASMARIFHSMVRSPSSLVWGVLFGVATWVVMADVAVPVLGMTDTQPMWEGLVGSAVFFGWPISETVAFLAHRGL